ncbi:MAG: TPM domain-containing protein [Vulcanimicrobiaceae bacterium]
MKRFAASLVLATAALGWALPASARTFVQDQAQMFSPATVAALNQRIGNFNAQTGKEILVVTVPTLNGADIATAASSAAQKQRLNGVIVFIAKNDRHDIILPGRAEVQSGWFTRDTVASIRQSMEAQFKSEDYDGGITTAVGSILGIYRSHLSSLQHGGAPNAVAANAGAPSGGGVHIGMFWWIIIFAVGFLIVRAIFRSRSAPRYYPPAQGGTPGAPGPQAPGTPPAGAPMPPAGPPMGGYGMGGYGGGGSFWSGLLGGLGGAWLGNEMFGNHGGGFGGGMAPGGPPDAGGGWGGGNNDGGGWANDAGQIDTSGGSSGDFGGGGFGDFGGGGGFGDGGDSGGGW